MISLANINWLRFIALLILCLFSGLIGAMGYAIANLLGIGFYTAPLWFTALILVYVASNMFSQTLLLTLSSLFRNPVAPRPKPRVSKRISHLVWSLLLLGSLTGYLTTALILNGAT